MKATVVFQWNWEAIHQRNPDGSRKYRYIINEGSSRSSKTRSLIQIYYLLAMQNAWRLSVWRDTKKSCKDTVGKDMAEVFPMLDNSEYVQFNKTESVYNFLITRATVEICGTDEPDIVHGYNGDVLWVNEPYKFSRETFDQLDMRTTEFIVIDWNPKQAHWIDELKKDPRTIVINSTYRHNPFCPNEQRIKIESYQPVKRSEVVESNLIEEKPALTYECIANPLKFTEKQIKELSRCQENERKATVNDFNWSVYGLGEKAEKPNRIFHWVEIPDIEYQSLELKKYIASDWGTVDPWGILEGKYYDGALYLHELNYLSENEIRGKMTDKEREQIGTGEDGIVKWRFNTLGIGKKTEIICDTNRPLKIQALWDAGFDYAGAAPKPPNSILDGIDLLNGLRVFFTTSSSNLKYEQENYERKTDRYGTVLEEAEDRDNHLIDCARYIALFLKLQGIIKNK